MLKLKKKKMLKLHLGNDSKTVVTFQNVIYFLSTQLA